MVAKISNLTWVVLDKFNNIIAKFYNAEDANLFDKIKDKEVVTVSIVLFKPDKNNILNSQIVNLVKLFYITRENYPKKVKEIVSKWINKNFVGWFHHSTIIVNSPFDIDLEDPEALIYNFPIN